MVELLELAVAEMSKRAARFGGVTRRVRAAYVGDAEIAAMAAYLGEAA